VYVSYIQLHFPSVVVATIIFFNVIYLPNGCNRDRWCHHYCISHFPSSY